MDKKRVIIIGGGFGGISLIRKLRDSDFEVVLLDRHNHHNFQPLLYQVATCGLSAVSIATPFRRMFHGYGNFSYFLTEVTRILPNENRVETTIGDFTYNYLVIATGSESNYFGNEGFRRNSIEMKTLDDAISIRNTLIEQFEKAVVYDKPDEQKVILNFIVIGGGATGVELAGALAEFKRHIIPKDYPSIHPSLMNIHLIEAGNRLLPAMSEGASSKAVIYLERMGVKIWLSTMVKNYDGLNVELTDGTVLRSGFFIWAAGVKGKILPGIPETSVRKSRIIVDEYNQVPGFSNLFALGDAALQATDKYPDGIPMLAFPAMQQGANLGGNLVRLLKGKPLKKFWYLDMGTLATVGRNRAVADLPILKTQGMFAWFLWMAIHLVRITGFRNRLIAFSDWIWNYFTYAFTYRIIARPSTRIDGNNLPGGA
jgi:NADH:ubiquinone reductase (H+-translocating)